MKFTGKEDHDFPLNVAAQWTKNYRQSPSFHAATMKLAHYFGKSAIQAILDQTDKDCVGMRVYYALDDAGVQQLIIVGVNSDGNDIYEGLLAERSVPCPDMCSAANPLNSDNAGTDPLTEPEAE